MNATYSIKRSEHGGITGSLQIENIYEFDFQELDMIVSRLKSELTNTQEEFHQLWAERQSESRAKTDS